MPTDVSKAVAALSSEEQSRLPASLRTALGLNDPRAAAWAAAKAERDSAIEAAYALEDPDERAAAIGAAKDAWAAAKSALGAEG